MSAHAAIPQRLFAAAPWRPSSEDRSDPETVGDSKPPHGGQAYYIPWDWAENPCRTRSEFQQRFSIDFDPEKYCRRTFPQLEAYIEDEWQAVLVRWKCWNGTKFRFHGYEEAAVLQLGFTDFRCFVGTTLTVLGRDGDDGAITTCGDENSAGHGLAGEFSCIRGRDGRPKGTQRHACSLRSLVADKIADLKEVEGAVTMQLNQNAKQVDSTLLRDCLYDEFWSTREIGEETGIRETHIAETLCVGLLERADGLPLFAFLLRLHVTKEEAQALYRQNDHEDAGESTELLWARLFATAEAVEPERSCFVNRYCAYLSDALAVQAYLQNSPFSSSAGTEEGLQFCLPTMLLVFVLRQKKVKEIQIRVGR
eukprot:g20742.t1